jgi:glycosyltransferase
MKISIITTVRNSARAIGDFIASVQRQTCRAEHIIIDGLCFHVTIEIIKRLQSSDCISFSKLDKGFYDAINKGLKLATSNAIEHLKADDVYVHDQMLERAVVFFAFPPVDSRYGELVYVSPWRPNLMVTSGCY